MKISFDYDGTLDQSGPVLDLFNILYLSSHDVCILTDMTEEEVSDCHSLNEFIYYHPLVEIICAPNYENGKKKGKIGAIIANAIQLHIDDNDAIVAIINKELPGKAMVANLLPRHEY